MKRTKVRETFIGRFNVRAILDLTLANDRSAFAEKFKVFWPDDEIRVTVELIERPRANKERA